jgi:hypothetical protein
MGYTTWFEGNFILDRPADKELQRILKGLHDTRRVKRNVDETIYGVEGEFYFEEDAYHYQQDNSNLVSYNDPPKTQPGLWCQWELQDDNVTIAWDEGEKFYHYAEWIKYIIDRVLIPRGYVLNGNVYWSGEESDDLGRLVVKDNHLEVQHGEVTYEKFMKYVIKCGSSYYIVKQPQDLYKIYNDFVSIDDDQPTLSPKLKKQIEHIRDLYEFVYEGVPCGYYTIGKFEKLAMKAIKDLI